MDSPGETVRWNTVESDQTNSSGVGVPVLQLLRADASSVNIPLQIFHL
jgi:hypothetical protein